MDPNAAYERIKSLMADGDSADVDLIEAWDALDGWLCKGSFLPTAWTRRR